MTGRAPDANVQRLAGVVIAADHGTALVSIQGEPWRLAFRALPEPLSPGQRIGLETPSAGGAGARPALLIVIDGRVLKPPVEVTARPEAPVRPPVVAAAASTLTVTVRPVDSGGAAAGALMKLQLRMGMPDLAGAPQAAPPAARPMLSADAPGPSVQAHREASMPTVARSGMAVVMGCDPSGRPLLEFEGQVLRVEARLEVPVGTRLLAITEPASRSPAPPSTAGLPPLLAALARLLGSPGDDAALQLPAPGGRLAAEILVLRRALGERRTGANGQDAVASGLKEVLAEAGQQARELLAGGWRLLQMPFGEGEGLIPIHLYQRDHEDWPDEAAGSDPEAGRRAQRMVLEADFSHLGRCQLDALCQAERFDLAVRTSEALPADLQAEIRAVYLGACNLARLAGDLTFTFGALLDLPRAAKAGDDVRV